MLKVLVFSSFRPAATLCTVALVLLCNPVHAQEAMGLTTNSKEPVEITADESLEWHRNDERFIAKGAAKAKQGESSIAAQTLTADYRKGATSSMEVYNLRGEGAVVLVSADNVAYGDVAVYDLDQGLATLTGQDLKMISPDQTITAQERFEYWSEKGLVNALGRAKVTRPKVSGGVDTLEADKLTASLKENALGKRVVDTIEAFGNVAIVTPTEVVTGAYGIYRAGSNKAELKGDVKIVRGPNTLEGERAEVNLTTNVSKIFGAPNAGTQSSSGGRVRGVFYPNSEKKPDISSVAE